MTAVHGSSDAWAERSAAASLACHRLIGWIFWDPGAVARYEALGVPDGMGYYVASRSAPLATAGNEAVVAAFYSVHRDAVVFSLDLARRHTTFDAVFDARNAAVGEGLATFVPEVVEPLAALVDVLWDAADSLDPAGRVLFATHLGAPRPDDATVSAWLALNCIREWRGDTHWAVLVAEDLDGVSAGLLHDAWMGYPGEWIPRSRGADDAAIAAALDRLASRGLARDGRVTDEGLALRQEIEDRTNRITERAWRHLGAEQTDALIDLLAPTAPVLLARIDATAGPDWMPAARDRRPRPA